MNTNTSLKYLSVAIDKTSNSLHPNFKRVLKPNTLLMFNNIRMAAAKAFDTSPKNPRAAIVAAGRALKNDAQAYVQFFKDIASSAAFAAHMDCIQLERAVDPTTLDKGLDAMGETHDIEDDVPPFDVGDAQRASPREPYEGSDTLLPIATSTDDAYAAIESIQAWIGLAFTAMPVEQQEYWGIDGLFPLGQRQDITISDEKKFTPLQTFDAYREWQTESWKRKQRVITFDVDTEALMLTN